MSYAMVRMAKFCQHLKENALTLHLEFNMEEKFLRPNFEMTYKFVENGNGLETDIENSD